LVCKEFRRISGRTKSIINGAERIELRKQLGDVRDRRTSSTGDKPETLESLKISKATLEAQVKQAVNLLAEETKRRINSEKKMKEMQEDLEGIKDPDRARKLEETIKKNRLANDSLQQQFVVQMETIANLEKKLKEYRTEKLEMETKYEERVYFMEERAKKKKEADQKESGTAVKQLSQTKQQLEAYVKQLQSRVEDLSRKLSLYRGEPVPEIQPERDREREGPLISTGPTDLPPRPKSSLFNLSSSSSSPDIPSKPTKTAPSLPKEKSEGKKTKIGGAFQQPELGGGGNLIGPVPSLPSNIQSNATSERARIPFDVWESSTTIVVAIDIPGVEMKLLDIYISRFAITISRKCGIFEEKNIASKYKPLSLQRIEKGKIGQFVKDQIILPCAVQPGRKQAFFHHGTVYLQLERLSEAYGEIQFSDWMPAPSF